jgi:hypothetical protein
MIMLSFWGFLGFMFIVIGMYYRNIKPTIFDTSFN